MSRSASGMCVKKKKGNLHSRMQTPRLHRVTPSFTARFAQTATMPEEEPSPQPCRSRRFFSPRNPNQFFSPLSPTQKNSELFILKHEPIKKKTTWHMGKHQDGTISSGN